MIAGSTAFPCYYEIRLRGRLDEQWALWFEDMTVSVEASEGQPATTLITGWVTDQAALYGLLSRIRDLGLPLLVVQRVTPSDENNEPESRT